MPATAKAIIDATSTSIAKSKKGDATANSNVKADAIAISKKDAKAAIKAASTSAAKSIKGDATANSNVKAGSFAKAKKGMTY